MRIYWYALKYWIQGDTWDEAVAYAKVICNNWRRND